MAEKSPKPLVLGFSKTVGVPPTRAGRTALALGNVGGRPRLALAPRVPVDDDGQEPARFGLRPEAITRLTTSASRPWCGSGCWSSG
jgi:hypothetical protein